MHQTRPRSHKTRCSSHFLPCIPPFTVTVRFIHSFFDISTICTVSRGKPCRSTPDASLSVQDASWAPHTPKSTIWRLRSRPVLHRVTKEAVTHTTARPGCLSSQNNDVVRASRWQVIASSRRSAGCVSTVWYHPTCVMPNSRCSGRQAGPRSM